MSPHRAEAAYGLLLREHITPALHERGFEGTRVFRLRQPTGWHLLTFHGSHKASNGKALVTLDVGAITEKAWLERREWSAVHTPSVKIPKLPTAMWADSERIGILRMGLDQWYEYAPDSDLAVLCARIMKDIDRFAVPFMEKRVPSKK